MKILRGLALPLLAALLLAALALIPTGSPASRPLQSEKVLDTSYACPAGQGRVVAATQVNPGTDVQATELPAAKPIPDLQDPDTFRAVTVSARDVLVRQVGSESGAVGFSAQERGPRLALAPCPGIIDQAWYTGLGSTTEQSSTLVLTNHSTAAAVVDFELFNRAGPVDAVDAEGVVVKPLSTRRIKVAQLAAGEREVAVQVQRRRGALSVVVQEDSAAGSDLISASEPPSSRALIAPLPASREKRQLRLVNPSDQRTQVRVQALAPEGPFVPEGLDELEVPAGSTVSVALPGSLGQSPVALALKSGQPVLGSVQTVTGSDTAVNTSLRPWRGAGIVPVRLGSAKLKTLTLAAVEEAGQVSIVARDKDGQTLSESTAKVKANRSVDVELGDLTARAATSLVLRSAGALVGSASFVTGEGLATVPIQAAPVFAEGPNVSWVPPGP